MADQEKDKDPGKEPPKIIPMGFAEKPASGPGTPGPVKSKSPDAGMPPRLRIIRANGSGQEKPAESQAAETGPSDAEEKVKKATTKIDLESAKPAAKEEAAPAAGRKVSTAKSDTTHIDLPEAQKPDQPSEEKQPEEPTPTVGRKVSTAKSDTTHIDLPEAKEPGEPPEEKQAKEEPEPPPKPARDPAETVPISEVDEEALEKAIQQQYQAAKDKTQRVALEEIEEEATAKDKTSRIDREAAAEEKPSKHETMPIDMQGEGEETPSRPPTTIRIKKPPVDEPPSGKTIALPDLTGTGKSETARIDLPKGAVAAPPTQRKTIRIKRPDGTTTARPVMTVSRPARDVRAEEEGEAEGAELEAMGVGTSVLALIATLAALVLVYVLAASLMPGLPFPGRLI